jgi:hypothetical protein
MQGSEYEMQYKQNVIDFSVNHIPIQQRLISLTAERVMTMTTRFAAPFQFLI